MLVTRGDDHVVRKVARNETARFSDTGFGAMVRRAEADDELQIHSLHPARTCRRTTSTR